MDAKVPGVNLSLCCRLTPGPAKIYQAKFPDNFPVDFSEIFGKASKESRHKDRLIKMLAALTLLTSPQLGFMPVYHQLPPKPPYRRAHAVVAYLDDMNSNLITDWTETDNGLSYKELARGTDELPKAGQIISITYTATLVSSGRVIDATGDKPLSFVLGEEQLPLFQEATQGMSVGGRRRVNVPSSKYAIGMYDPTSGSTAKLEGETIQFEMELTGIQTGKDALLFRIVQNRENIFRVALLLSFLPDILHAVGVLPDAPSSSFGTEGFGAVDILSNSAPAVDAANAWAAQGLQGFF